MIDIRRIRTNIDEVKEGLKKRMKDLELKMIDTLVELDDRRREILAEVEVLKNKKNIGSSNISKYKKEGKNIDLIMEEMKILSDNIKDYEEELKSVEEQIEFNLLRIPNIPNSKVPAGKSDNDNIEIRRWGTAKEFEFIPKAHWDIGMDTGILDFESAGKVTGARFTFYKGLGARLERACINFMIDYHTQNGYTEVLPPFMVNRKSLIGTSQLPKFEEDMFKIDGIDLFLIPTAEVPLTNFHRDEIINAEKLTINYTAYTACFRAEAGSAGRDTRGLIRQHQFNKVELVKITHPQKSYIELEQLTKDAEMILQLLELPYRVVNLCSGDLGFGSAQTYDVEVWMPNYGRYVEISSCSNMEDFQARRANIRYRESINDKPQFVHTLNGSGLAVGRTVAAILENYQQNDGSILVPKALRRYMGGVEKIINK